MFLVSYLEPAPTNTITAAVLVFLAGTVIILKPFLRVVFYNYS